MSDTQPVSLSLRGVTLLPQVGPFRPVLLDTSQGPMEGRLYPSEGATGAILWLGDAGPEFASPASGAFDRLAERFASLGAASLMIQYRRSTDQAESALDGLLGAFLLQHQGFERLVVVGHGIGALGAVQAGLTFPSVVGVALLAPPAVAATDVAKLSPTPLLVLHGTADKQTPTSASRELVAKAGEPKRIYYYQGAGHNFDEVETAMTEELSEWLGEQLALSPAS